MPSTKRVTFRVGDLLAPLSFSWPRELSRWGVCEFVANEGDTLDEGCAGGEVMVGAEDEEEGEEVEGTGCD